MKAIADASFLIALVNKRESAHSACANIALEMAREIVVPATSIPEAAHILLIRRGHFVMREFVKRLDNPLWEIEPFSSDDLPRISKLLAQYQDANIDFNDCAIVAQAERLNVEIILTLDHRDFRMIRPKHIPHFIILPE